MATVFMKWLETTPGDYDRGIELLTLGCLTSLKEHIAEELVHPGDRVLEIGCGTGTLALMMAQRGASVTGIDASPLMLAEARRKIAEADLSDAIQFHEMDVSELSDHFAPQSFDVIVSTLAFSEFPPEAQRYALDEAHQLLRPDGRLLIADEVVPQGPLARFLFYAVRLPLVVLTWLLTRTTTNALRGFSTTLSQAGFASKILKSHLAGSLQLAAKQLRQRQPSPGYVTRLQSKRFCSTCIVCLTASFHLIPKSLQDSTAWGAPIARAQSSSRATTNSPCADWRARSTARWIAG
jgi:demethylmenaquinone methyltransferase/2-methoxy-6-polyprenyl-1,4-benzoquinol methylase